VHEQKSQTIIGPVKWMAPGNVSLKSLMFNILFNIQKTYVCNINNRQKAKGILSEHGYQAIDHKEGLELILEKEQVPEIVKILVENQINIYEFKMIVKSLEDRFLEITNNEEVTVNA